MNEFFTHAAWFALGIFFGAIAAWAFIENANARSMEELCADIEDE